MINENNSFFEIEVEKVKKFICLGCGIFFNKNSKKNLHNKRQKLVAKLNLTADAKVKITNKFTYLSCKELLNR
jgi:hypothetical protein